MARTFPDIREVHNVADVRFLTNEGNNSCTLTLHASGEVGYLAEVDGVRVEGILPAVPGTGQKTEGEVLHVAVVVSEDGQFRSLPLVLAEGERLVRIEPDWYAEANPEEE